MKKSKLIGLLSVGIMTIAGSLLANNSQNLASSNLEALSEAAGDMWCDQSNDKPCSIEAPTGHIGRSTGKLRVHWD